MTTINTPTFIATILDERTVHIQAQEGVEVNAESVHLPSRQISELFDGDYGMIVDRKADYSLDPVPVYNILNGIPNLKAIAIVCYRSATLGMIDMEKKLFRGELQVFSSLDSARSWLAQRFAASD